MLSDRVPMHVGAAATMGFAMLIGHAPFGVISSSILVPVLPSLTALRDPQDIAPTVARIATSLLCVLLPIVALMSVLSEPLVFLLLSGKAFQLEQVRAVAQLLPFVCLGGASGVVRDLLVRAFYAQQLGRFPLLVTSAMIAANAALDATSLACGWGVSGLVLSTAATNVMGIVLLVWGLSRRADGWQPAAMAGSMARIAALTGCTWLCSHALYSVLRSSLGGVSSRLVEFGICSACSSVGVTVFVVLLLLFPGDLIRERQAAIKLARKLRM